MKYELRVFNSCSENKDDNSQDKTVILESSVKTFHENLNEKLDYDVIFMHLSNFLYLCMFS